MTPENLVSDAFRWQEDSAGTWLCVKTTRRQAEQICAEVKPDKKYAVKISQHRNKRSLDANAYFWQLVGKLAAKVGVTPLEIYRQYIPDVADNFTIVPVRADLVKEWERIWCSGHMGRMVEDLGPCRNIDGYHNVMSYYSSSDYDTAQMSRLIDLVVQDCKSNDIETMTPDQLALLKEEWGRKNGA